MAQRVLLQKTIHLINTNDTLTYPPPFNYGWWGGFSDIYEETNNTGVLGAFAGCYGLLTRGSASFRNHGMWQTRV